MLRTIRWFARCSQSVLLLVLAGVYVPPLLDLLDTHVLPFGEAAIATLVGLAGWGAVRATSRSGSAQSSGTAG